MTNKTKAAMEYDALMLNQGNYELNIYSPDGNGKMEIEIGWKDIPESYSCYNLSKDEATRLRDFLSKYIK